MTHDTRHKTGLTWLVIFAVIVSGLGYQYYYDLKKVQYRGMITGYYQKYFDREPDAPGLHHWTMWALNKWGIEKVEREGFIKAKEQGYR